MPRKTSMIADIQHNVRKWWLNQKSIFFFNSQINLTTLHLIADVLWFKWQDSVIHLSEALCLWKSEPKELMSFWCVIMTSEHGRNVWCCIWFLCEQEASLLLGKTQLDCLAIAGKVSDICKCACLAKLIDPATYTCMYAQADPNMSGLNMIAGCSMMLRTPTLPYLLILSDALHCLESIRSIACCLPMLLLPYPLERPRYTQSRWAFYWQRQERIRATIVCGIPSWIAFGSLFQAIWQIIMCCNRQISIINWYPHSGRPRHVWPFEALLLVMEMHLKVRKAFLKNTRNSSPNCRLASHVVIHASIMSCPTGSLRLK